jgi:hypothetical protein
MARGRQIEVVVQLDNITAAWLEVITKKVLRQKRAMRSSKLFFEAGQGAHVYCVLFSRMFD